MVFGLGGPDVADPGTKSWELVTIFQSPPAIPCFSTKCIKILLFTFVPASVAVPSAYTAVNHVPFNNTEVNAPRS